MNRRTAILGLLFIPGYCKKDPKPETYVNPYFIPYYETFLKEAEIRGVKLKPLSISIDFGQVPPGAAAVTTFTGTVYVTFKNDFDLRVYDDGNLKADWRELIFFHEMGHAYFKYGHTENRIMAGTHLDGKFTLFDVVQFKHNRTEWLDEYFE